MGNNASKHGEKDREKERDVPPSSPVVNHTVVSASASASSSSPAEHRRETRSGSLRRPHREDTSASSSLRPHGTPQAPLTGDTTAAEHPRDDKMGAENSKQRRDERHKAKAAPVRVPRGTDPNRQRGPDSQFESFGPPRDPNYIPHSNLNFPPRLPLPIEEEIHSPGSPVITAQGDDVSTLPPVDVDGPLPRQSSAISSTTVEDDEVGNDFSQTQHEPAEGYVPTQVSWRQGGEKIYVTGTFAQWSTKIRMQKDPNTGHHSAVLQLRPGTHHVKFIVDGEMQLSDELPTAADFTNILVNYIEVSADDVPREQPTSKPQEEVVVPEGVFPPQVLPPGTEARDHAPDSIGKTQAPESQIKAEPVFWGKELPKYLRDVEQPEHTNKYQRSARVVSDFPTPPGLPLFLGKSILNGTTPMKDDASVLNMPNHTVLNHLATSSIKNEVLATSITTRYIRKYVTTIVYKPTEDHD